MAKKRKKRRPKWSFKKHWLPLAILALVVGGLYAQTLFYEYVLDDKIVYTENDYVKKGFSGIPDILGSDSFKGYFGEQKDLLMGARYRPLSIVAFAVEFGIVGKTDPMMSHLINVLLYILLGWLIYYLVFKLNISWPYKQWFIALPFLVSLFFLLHPVHVEAVANVKGRDEVLTLGVSLLSLYFFYEYYRKGKNMMLILGSIVFFLALLFKENALTFFAVIPACLWVFLKYKAGRMTMSFVGLVLPIILYLILRVNVIGYLLDPPGGEIDNLLNQPFVEMNAAQKYATITYTLGVYLKLLVFPYPLTHDYYPYHIPIMEWSNWKVLLSLLANLSLFVLSLYGVWKRKTWGFALFFYFATISIVSNVFVSIGSFMNDRFAFMPSLGFCLLLPFLIQWVTEKAGGHKAIFYSLGALIVAGYLFQNIDRIPDWKSSYTLNASAIKVSKNSARANLFMGVELYNQYRDETDPEVRQELVSRAAKYFNRSLEIYPEYSSAIKMKAGILGAQFTIDRDLDALLDEFYKVLQKQNVPYIKEFMNYVEDRAWTDKDKILQFYHRIGYEYYYQELGNRAFGMEYLNRAYQLDQNSPFILRDLAIINEKVNPAKAKNYAVKALQFYPQDVNLQRIAGK